MENEFSEKYLIFTPIGGEVNVLPMEENRNFDLEVEGCDDVTEGDVAASTLSDIAAEDTEAGGGCLSEREEYDLLVKKRFKDLYSEDVQRLINRRFRKYKAMEERFKLLEEELSLKEAWIVENKEKIEGFDATLRSEVDKAIKETEERVIKEIKTRQTRPVENGVMPRINNSSFDVSRLTKGERASLAKRAAGGEKIIFK